MTEKGMREQPTEAVNAPRPPGTDPARRPEDRTTATARFRRLMGGGDGSAQPRRSSVVVSGEPAGRSGSGRRRLKGEFAGRPVGDETVGRGRPWSRGGYRVRRVRRLIRHIEPWSVLKVGLIFYLCVWGLLVIAVRTLWRTAESGGTIERVESFVEDLFALESFEFDTGQIFRIFTLGGLVLVLGGTALTVVLVVLFNLISDLTGGVRFTMVEEETAVRQRRLRAGEDAIADPTSGPSGGLPGREAARS